MGDCRRDDGPLVQHGIPGTHPLETPLLIAPFITTMTSGAWPYFGGVFSVAARRKSISVRRFYFQLSLRNKIWPDWYKILYAVYLRQAIVKLDLPVKPTFAFMYSLLIADLIGFAVLFAFYWYV